jgi:hypothetical protein
VETGLLEDGWLKRSSGYDDTRMVGIGNFGGWDRDKGRCERCSGDDGRREGHSGDDGRFDVRSGDDGMMLKSSGNAGSRAGEAGNDGTVRRVAGTMAGGSGDDVCRNGGRGDVGRSYARSRDDGGSTQG